MKTLTDKQAIELFHLLFLEHFGRTTDKSLYALKGGYNLRFFLASSRYSEDMDIDIQTIEKGTLQNKVDRLLKSTPFNISLKAKGISIVTTSAPKQTETTQRWKILLQLSSGATTHTKIEFSRRGLSESTCFELVNRELTLSYQLAPIMTTHYTKEVAFTQKIKALAGRPVTQARDLFDLYHLVQFGVSLDNLAIDDTLKAEAISAATAIDYKDYCSQVVAYLPAELQDNYRTKAMWDSIALTVIAVLES